MSGKPTLKIVAYYRVSTDKQGRSGLGLDAQRSTVEAYAKARDGRVVAEYTEVESGKRSDRPELAKALAHARRTGARLVVAKLDRLARNVRFLMGLVESGAELGFCDLPDLPPGPAGRHIIQTMASVAELEAGLISERTKAALKALKARGKKLGAANPDCQNLTPTAAARGREQGAAGAAAAATLFADDMGDVVAELSAGKSLRQAASSLNDAGYVTRRGKLWTAAAVARVLSRTAS